MPQAEEEEHEHSKGRDLNKKWTNTPRRRRNALGEEACHDKKERKKKTKRELREEERKKNAKSRREKQAGCTKTF